MVQPSELGISRGFKNFNIYYFKNNNFKKFREIPSSNLLQHGV